MPMSPQNRAQPFVVQMESMMHEVEDKLVNTVRLFLIFDIILIILGLVLSIVFFKILPIVIAAFDTMISYIIFKRFLLKNNILKTVRDILNGNLYYTNDVNFEKIWDTILELKIMVGKLQMLKSNFIQNIITVAVMVIISIFII